MSPQHSPPAQADLRWRDGLQANYCTDYAILHNQAMIMDRSVRCNSPSFSYLSLRHSPLLTDARTVETSLLNPELNDSETTIQDGHPSCFGSVFLRSNAGETKQTFNRMNGSPGAPPGTRMQTLKPKRITPFNHRLASDPIGMEAGWEMQIFNHFLSLRTSSRTELVQARMQGPKINNNSTKNKG